MYIGKGVRSFLIKVFFVPFGLPEREARAERSQIYHSEREGLLSSSSQSVNFIGTGKLVA